MEIIAFIFLFIAIASLWIRPIAAYWWIFFIVSTSIGLTSDVLSHSAIYSIIAFAGLCYLKSKSFVSSDFYKANVATHQKRENSFVWIVNVIFIIFIFGLALHKFPGYVSYLVAEEVFLHEQAPPVHINFKFDTAIIGLLIFAFCLPRIAHASEWLRVFKSSIPIVAITSAGVFSVAVAGCFMNFDPVFTPHILLFILSNLFISVIAEEAIFRGWIQTALSQRFQFIKHGAYLALILTSFLFGLAHFAGGVWLILAAFLAGLGYGFAYLKTKRIEAAIICHLSVNTVHFVFFSYPYLIA